MSQQAVDGAGNWGRRQRQRNFLLVGWCRRRMASLVVDAEIISALTTRTPISQWPMHSNKEYDPTEKGRK
jgi:hypothetical protein